jgi:hypothetical protein
VCDQARAWSAQAVGHLERVEHEFGAHVRSELPADDPTAVAVEDEGEVDEAVPGADVGQVGDPLLVRVGCREVPLQEVARPFGRGLVWDRRPLLRAAQLPDQAVLTHDARDLVAADLDVTPAQFLPRLASAVHASATAAGRLDRDQQLPVGELAPGRLPGSARVVRAHRHADRSADRLDPEGVPPLLHVTGHRRRVGSSSCAK